MKHHLPTKWDFEADVVSIGSGIGSLSSAITTHDHAAQALMLERSDRVGGVTALSMGEVWVAGNHLARQIGIEDSPENGFRYLKRLSMGYGNDLSILNLVVHAREALKYFEEKSALNWRLSATALITITDIVRVAFLPDECWSRYRSLLKPSGNGNTRPGCHR